VASSVNEAWKYEKIYDSAAVIKMEGFNSPFGGSSKERDIKLDHKKLTLEHKLGTWMEETLAFFAGI